MEEHNIPVDRASYATSFVDKYLDNATVKTSTKFYKTTFPSDMIFTKASVSTSDDRVKELTGGFNIRYRACIVSLIYLLS